jgi:hypothetical protein
MSEKVQFQTNVPIDVALKYNDGKKVTGQCRRSKVAGVARPAIWTERVGRTTPVKQTTAPTMMTAAQAKAVVRIRKRRL